MIRKSDRLQAPVALFPGSFNPFTRGHQSVVERALSFCGSVIIAVGTNATKEAECCPEARLAPIRRIFAGNSRVRVEAYSGLTTDFATRVSADFILRGIRTIADFEYERQMADINRDLSGIETVFLPTLPELGHISSSIVRELEGYGKVPSAYIPDASATTSELKDFK